VTASGSPPHILSPPTFQSTLLTACICHLLTSVPIARFPSFQGSVTPFPTRCSSVPHLSVIVNGLSTNANTANCPLCCTFGTCQPRLGLTLRCDPGLVPATLARSSFIFLQPAHRRFIIGSCSCGVQVQMNLTSLAFLPTTHARAVDGNHHCPALLGPACAFSVVWRREVIGKGSRIDFSPCWKALS